MKSGGLFIHVVCDALGLAASVPMNLKIGEATPPDAHSGPPLDVMRPVS